MPQLRDCSLHALSVAIAFALSSVTGFPAQAQTASIPDKYRLGPLPDGIATVEHGASTLSIPGTVDLSRAWRLALEHDHTYLAAISEQAATQTQRQQGRSVLLPQVQAGYWRSKVTGTIEQPYMGRRLSSDVSYDSTNAYIQLQQPLLNYERYATYRRGAARAQQGSAVFAVKQQETGIRLATAYFNLLLAYDDWRLQRALTESLASQAQALEARYRQSEGTSTDVQETQARLAVARADVIAADDRLRVAARELQALVGAPVSTVAGLSRDFPLLPLIPASLQQWLERAANNADVRSAQEAVRVADAEVDRAASRYFPTMDLVASYGKADSENLSTLSQRSNTFIVGIQVNIPIFTGGYNTANVSRAHLDRRRLQQELDATRERVQATITRQYTNVQGGAERINALAAAVESSQLSLDSAEKSFLYGAVSNLDVLKTQDKLYQAKYQLVKARLEYLLAHMELASAVGELESVQFDRISNVYLGPAISLDGERG
ncbi:TolC family outer membrane protein [Pollutimonas nitritireducens]|nr:TolC family outer membrane protein [Pollutimonas nitritireducens]